MSARTYAVSLSVITDDPHKAFKATEVFGRVALGLSMDDIVTRQDIASYMEKELEVEDEADDTGSDPDEKGCGTSEA